MNVGSALLDEELPGGAAWSRVCRRGTALRLEDLDGSANVAALLYRAEDPLERYCMPDTLKAQHVARLTAGVALYSDMGRVLASIVEDSCGWHDTIAGHTTAAILAARWGANRYQDDRNAWRRDARESLLVELAKHGLAQRDLVANVNFFSRVGVGEDGRLGYVAGNSRPGAHVTLRFELDCLVVLSSAPHPLDPSPAWAPGAVRLTLAPAPPPGPDDAVRTACAENERGFAETERVLA